MSGIKCECKNKNCLVVNFIFTSEKKNPRRCEYNMSAL